MQKLGPWKKTGSILEITKNSESSSFSPCCTLADTAVSFLAGSYLLLPFLIVQLQKHTISSCDLCICGCALGYGGGGWWKRRAWGNAWLSLAWHWTIGSPESPPAAAGIRCLAGRESTVLSPPGETEKRWACRSNETKFIQKKKPTQKSSKVPGKAAWHSPAFPMWPSLGQCRAAWSAVATKRKSMSDQTRQLQDTDEALSIKPFNSQTTHMHNVLLHSVKRKKKMQFVFFLIQTEFQVYIYRIFKDSYPSC